MIDSLENLMFKLHISLIFVANIKFPRATYHTIVPSTEELYRLISASSPRLVPSECACTLECTVRTTCPYDQIKTQSKSI